VLYGDIQTNFATILNRRDLTASQTTLFAGMAIQRIQRSLRIPAMENVLPIITDGTGLVPIPGDLIEVISLNTNDSTNQEKLVKTTLENAVRKSQIPGVPTVYYRQGANWIIGNVPAAGTVLYVTYYQDASALVAPTDHNWLTDVAPDLLIYGMLAYAADFFLDERKQGFESTFSTSLGDLQEQAHMDELENASVGLGFSTEDDQYYSYSIY